MPHRAVAIGNRHDDHRRAIPAECIHDRLLECLSEMLASTSYRDVTVIDVARLAGTSPATFYQYFPDIQAAVVELAGDFDVPVPALRTVLGLTRLLDRSNRRPAM